MVGVYPLHFHRAGYATADVVDSVVQGTPGWGIVNHSSNVDADDNVVHDFVGSAYVSEAGDELGSFTDSLASGGTNHPNGPKVAAREAVSPEQRARAAEGDMGSSRRGSGWSVPRCGWRTTSWREAGVRRTSSSASAPWRTAAGPGRPWTSSRPGRTPAPGRSPNHFTGATMGLTPDMPVKSFRGNSAYGVFQGLRIRWSNSSDGFLLTRNGTSILPGTASQIAGDSEQVKRTVTALSDLTFWNVASGVTAGYSKGYDLDNVTVVNGPEYRPDCTNGAMCTESGIDLSDGGGGNTSQIRHSRVVNVADPIVLANKAQQTLVDTTVDGKPFVP